ncbi:MULTISPECIES: hypothetical protein [Rhodomicrobium]|uniref:hypothetical protein n=1 Tax=Rhodomicrobium TaxID=1068 RepID=UPI000B4A70D6|nr:MULTISPECIES: hypothetical protein [Rhodomicrobium]
MTMMNGFDAAEIDILDEEYFGPPPRFLVEDRHADSFALPRVHDAHLPALARLKELLGVR